MRDTSSLRVPASYIISLVREFGLLLEDHGSPLDVAALEEAAPTGQAKIELLFLLLDALHETIGPEWPVKSSFAWRNQMHGTIEVAARSASTLGEALDVLGKYGRVRAPFANIKARETHRHRIFVYVPAITMEQEQWQALAEFMVLGTVAILHQATDDGLAGATAIMPGREFAHRQLLIDALRIPIRFDGDEFALQFEKTACAVTLPFRDPTLFNATVQQLEKDAIQLASQSWLIRDIGALLDAHRGMRPNASSVAKALGMSQRSMVRKLAVEGTSFRELLDDHLKSRAASLLEQGTMSLEEIAEELGYGDRTSFSRARRRWFRQH